MRIFIIFFMLFAFAFGDGHKYKHKYIYNNDLSFLDLSQNQQEEIKNILKNYSKKLKHLRELKDDIEDEKEDLFKESEFDKDKFIELQTGYEMTRLSLQAELLAQIHAVLDKKQRKQLSKNLEHWNIR
ncbi:hypothetical protein CIG11343_0494 [Campylobacter iguaniorum]|uniref:Spy/CpxP family protein refolding chaperone n=1 Tax=Campylobacter iguaniorum TaxID=1244531 RepID=UPI0007C8ECAE|nr:hypothetical protein [Campylobacter iguaniorum]ANE35573.1 hypothetical protein CIG11343_0494 [Campylobacter iguaniorum]